MSVRTTPPAAPTPRDSRADVAERTRAEVDTALRKLAGGPSTPHGRRARGQRKPTLVDAAARLVAVAYLIALLIVVVSYKAVFLDAVAVSPLLTGYGLIVCGYIVSRFVLSLLYRPARDAGLEPHVAIVMPAFNEGQAIGASLRSLLALDYPGAKLEIVAVDDGSTDGTLEEIRAVAREAGGRVQVIDLGVNQGKRAAMAAGIRATDTDIVAFVDSDSVLEPDALRILVQGFADERVGAICGHADVLNARENWLTKMQAVRYFVAFQVIKAAESIFSTVTCCSGCFSAYRREAIMPHLDWWGHQTFLGKPSTFGDDRSLTNCVMRGWKVRYESRAVSQTLVPDDLRQFMAQQLRWKRSWTRESLLVGSFIWRKHPIAAVSTYVSVALPLIAPLIAVRAVIVMPFAHGMSPFVYLVGVYAMAVAYGLYYVVRRRRYDSLWIYGIVFCFFYFCLLLWQTYWAILTARSSAWGTRPSTVGMDERTRRRLAEARS
jgi:hyaluronan synthase